MATRRDLIDADDFARHRTVAALLRGDTRETEEVPRRPNVWLVAGVVIALLIGAGSAVTAFLGDRAPDGWNADNSLVLDEDTGASYVAQGGALRPSPTLTAALLAGARREPVVVPHARVLESPVGAPLPGSGTPSVPPAVAGRADLTACITGTGAVDVFSVPPLGPPSAATGLLVRAFGTSELGLVSDRRLHAVDESSLIALGYTPVQIREVPQTWFDLVPRGPDLVLQRPVPSPSGGLPEVADGGETVESAETGRRYLVSGGQLRPLANRTTELLVPPPSSRVPEAVLNASPLGPPAGLVDVPTEPPLVPAREEIVSPCVRSGDGQITLAAGEVDDASRTRDSPSRVLGRDPDRVVVTWHFPPGEGALLGPPGVDLPPPPGSDPDRDEGIVLVDAGVGHPVANDQSLRALGYDRAAVAPVPPPWFRLIAGGVALRASER